MGHGAWGAGRGTSRMGHLRTWCLGGGLLIVSLAAVGACRGSSIETPVPAPAPRPSILLVTLDTTRADAIGPGAAGVETPAFNALAGRGRLFRQAYATVPETLPSHASMMTGLYPAGHGVHENARYLSPAFPVAAERLAAQGYRTAAFVSSFVLAGRFGLARGFGVYDDTMPAGREDRPATATTDAALAFLASAGAQPVFVWVHYWEPHHPYEPPEPFRTRYAASPYLGEVAAMDEQLGRLVEGFGRLAPRPQAIIVAGDHGEGLGDHGESQHGNLLYQSTMHVPLVLVGPGVGVEATDAPVSVRRIFHTLLDLAGLGGADSLRGASAGVVLGEAMKPYLEYGWQPQIMAVSGMSKTIFAGRYESYDLARDPREGADLGAAAVPVPLRQAVDEYPVPSPDAAKAPAMLDPEALRKLASLGYVSATAAPVVRKDAPRPVDMVRLFDTLEAASALFVQGKYREVIPVLDRVLAADPYNLDAMLRLATAHSILGREARALEVFRLAAERAPGSEDVRVYLALHQARGTGWAQAVPVLESTLAQTPDRVPVVEALASVRERQGRPGEAVALWQRAYRLRGASAAEWLRLGDLAMGAAQTDAAIAAFESARQARPEGFARDLELGVLYLSARRFDEARAALDRVPRSHPAYAMALFKRAQVSVLLGEPDAAARVAAARGGADRRTRELVAKERLFAGF